jgi:hypothetical protein
MLVLRRCSGNGIGPSWRRMLMLSTVCSLRCAWTGIIEPRLLRRPDREEGRQDTADEYGDAGTSGRLVSSRFVSRRVKLRKVTCHPYLFDGAVSPSRPIVIIPPKLGPGTRTTIHYRRTSDRELGKDDDTGQTITVLEAQRIESADFQPNESRPGHPRGLLSIPFIQYVNMRHFARPDCSLMRRVYRVLSHRR